MCVLPPHHKFISLIKHNLDMDDRIEVKLAKEIIQNNNLEEKVLKDTLKKLFIREGLSASSAGNYIYVLVALELAKEEDPFIILDKKLFKVEK